MMLLLQGPILAKSQAMQQNLIFGNFEISVHISFPPTIQKKCLFFLLKFHPYMKASMWVIFSPSGWLWWAPLNLDQGAISPLASSSPFWMFWLQKFMDKTNPNQFAITCSIIRVLRGKVDPARALCSRHLHHFQQLQGGSFCSDPEKIPRV
jgi:hypothetical protein